MTSSDGPLVSVVMSCFNTERCIGEVVENSSG